MCNITCYDVDMLINKVTLYMSCRLWNIECIHYVPNKPD